ncbi:MAG: hypothetical protein WDZ30_01085 [Cellvibrionaceae bacterium]
MSLTKTVGLAKQLTLGVGLTLVAISIAAADRYYRYVDENGVKVMDSRIPPEYVKNGYEIVTISGQVLDVIPPAPSPEEVEQRAAERKREAELAEWDRRLLRRYSSVADINAAKERKLADFDASMAILHGNANNLEAQIEEVQRRAADIERAGREVPEVLLDNLEKLHADLELAREQIDSRLVEKVELEKGFDRDIERFATIKPGS